MSKITTKVLVPGETARLMSHDLNRNWITTNAGLTNCTLSSKLSPVVYGSYLPGYRAVELCIKDGDERKLLHLLRNFVVRQAFLEGRRIVFGTEIEIIVCVAQRFAYRLIDEEFQGHRHVINEFNTHLYINTTELTRREQLTNYYRSNRVYLNANGIPENEVAIHITGINLNAQNTAAIIIKCIQDMANEMLPDPHFKIPHIYEGRNGRDRFVIEPVQYEVNPNWEVRPLAIRINLGQRANGAQQHFPHLHHQQLGINPNEVVGAGEGIRGQGPEEIPPPPNQEIVERGQEEGPNGAREVDLDRQDVQEERFPHLDEEDQERGREEGSNGTHEGALDGESGPGERNHHTGEENPMRDPEEEDNNTGRGDVNLDDGQQQIIHHNGEVLFNRDCEEGDGGAGAGELDQKENQEEKRHPNNEENEEKDPKDGPVGTEEGIGNQSETQREQNVKLTEHIIEDISENDPKGADDMKNDQVNVKEAESHKSDQSDKVPIQEAASPLPSPSPSLSPSLSSSPSLSPSLSSSPSPSPSLSRSLSLSPSKQTAEIVTAISEVGAQSKQSSPLKKQNEEEIAGVVAEILEEALGSKLTSRTKKMKDHQQTNDKPVINAPSSFKEEESNAEYKAPMAEDLAAKDEATMKDEAEFSQSPSNYFKAVQSTEEDVAQSSEESNECYSSSKSEFQEGCVDSKMPLKVASCDLQFQCQDFYMNPKIPKVSSIKYEDSYDDESYFIDYNKQNVVKEYYMAKDVTSDNYTGLKFIPDIFLSLFDANENAIPLFQKYNSLSELDVKIFERTKGLGMKIEVCGNETWMDYINGYKNIRGGVNVFIGDSHLYRRMEPFQNYFANEGDLKLFEKFGEKKAEKFGEKKAEKFGDQMAEKFGEKNVYKFGELKME